MLVRGDKALADDLVQAAFHAASLDWRGLRRLAEDQRHGWLRATLASIAISWFHGEAAARDWLPAADIPRGMPQAGQTAHAKQPFSPVTMERCWQIIQSMPEPQHAVALLHWLLDLKEAEVAAALGMADKTVSAHLERARRKLIAQLGPEDPHTGRDPDGA